MTEQRYHPVSVAVPPIDVVAEATHRGYSRDLTFDDSAQGSIKVDVTPIPCQVRAPASWGGPDMREHSVAFIVESSIPMDLTNIRAVDRFGDANDLLLGLARDVQRVIQRDVLVHGMSATYATSDLRDRGLLH